MAELATQQPMENINANCSAPHAYKFNIINKAMLGYIHEMTFTGSGKSLKPDTPMSDPQNPDSKITVVAVLDYIKWVGGPTDPIEIRGRLSQNNEGIMRECISSLTGGSDIELSWSVAKYNDSSKGYFQRFHTDGKKIKCVLTQGTQVVMDEMADSQIQQPVNYCFFMSVTPKSEGEEQTLCCATSPNQKFARQFGINVGG